MTSHAIKQFAGLPTPRALLPIGDPERDRRTVLLAKNQWRDVSCTIYEWEKALNELKDDKIAERYPPDKPYGSLDRLLKEEIGLTIDESRSNIATRTQVQSTQATPANKPGNPTGNNQYQVKEERKGYNCNNSTNRGNDPEYLTSVIARDHPDILERMKAGEFRSVRAAAIEAGITKPDKTWTAPTDIPKLVRAIRQRYNETEIDILKAMI